MPLTFGTDGIRGDARNELTPPVAAALGAAAASTLGAERFAIGRDTRASGPALVEAIQRGVGSVGGSSADLGVVPTPTVARWCADEVVAGAVVSASHNPWTDNGVKFFAPGGHKLDDDSQGRIQTRFQELMSSGAVLAGPIAGEGVPAKDAGPSARRRHLEAVAASIDGRRLDGLTIMLDCANGAASILGPECLRSLGVRLRTINDSPDGRNINDRCGSLHPEMLQAAVLDSSADIGLAFDGDADRLLAVDHRGGLIDGDQMIALFALDRQRRGELRPAAVVVTVMSNLGFRRAMAAAGIAVVDTAVGDRHVMEALDEKGLVLGGEQSGHLIFRDLATTGDGLLTAVQLLDVVQRSSQPLADLAASAMTRLPQVLLNVPAQLRSTDPADLDATLSPLLREAERRLGEHGRVLVRPSGTEPVVRVMVEAADESTARGEAQRLAAEITAALPPSP